MTGLLHLRRSACGLEQADRTSGSSRQPESSGPMESFADFLNGTNTGKPSPDLADATTCLQTDYLRFWQVYPRMRVHFADRPSNSVQAMVLGAGEHCSEWDGYRCSPQIIETVAVLQTQLAELTVIDRDPDLLHRVAQSSVYGPQTISFKRIPDDQVREQLYRDLQALVGLPGQMDDIDLSRWYPVRPERWSSIPLRTHCAFFQDLDYGRSRIDCVLATWSLYYAFQNDPKQSLDLFGRLLQALRPLGVLWIDETSLQYLNIDGIIRTVPMHRGERVSLILQLLQQGTNVRFTCQRIDDSELFEIIRW